MVRGKGQGEVSRAGEGRGAEGLQEGGHGGMWEGDREVRGGGRGRGR